MAAAAAGINSGGVVLTRRQQAHQVARHQPVQRTARPLGAEPKHACQREEAAMATPHDDGERHSPKIRIVLETDGNVIAEKVSGHGLEGAGSFTEQTISQALATAREHFARSLLK